METKVSKRVKFVTIISIIFAVTSLFYLGLAVAYFIAMGVTLMTGNEYEMLGFIFGLIGLPLAIIILAFPVFRVIILVLSLNIRKKYKEGRKAKGMAITTAVMQIIDAVASPVAFFFIGSLIFLFSQDIFNAIPGGGLLYTIFGLTINIPVIAKGVLQIIASVMLFKSAGELY